MVEVCFDILMDLLKNRKVTAKYLSEKYEVSLRSIYRYIDVLSSAGVAIFCERGRNGGIMIADSYRLPATLLTKDEQSAILGALNLYKGTNPTFDIDKIRDKIFSVNTSDTIDNLVVSGDKLMLEGIIGDEKQYRGKITPITEAIDQNKKLQITYHDRGGEITTRIIEPHAIVLSDLMWYVYAYCEMRQGFRMFKISRIEKILTLDETFTRRPQSEFTPWNMTYNKKFEAVNILFSVKEKSRYAVEEWLGIENVKKQKNKKYPYIASATVANDDNLIPKLLSFGTDIDILSPVEIKKEIIKKAGDILTLYTKK